MAGGGNQAKPSRTLGPLWFSLLAVVVGIVAGLGAVVFRGLIALFHNLLFLGEISLAYNANEHTPSSPWGPLVILVPVVGACGVAFLVKNFAPEAKGHGVPEVMDAIYHDRGKIRPIVALIKALASGLSIGSGGSVGREGPIIQIGASFGSMVAQLLRVPVWQRITMIAGGAGGGIAATFNTPVGGLLFAAELMMHEISARTLVPVAIATGTATYIGSLFFGAYPSFVIPSLEALQFRTRNPLVLLSYAGLGVLMGFASALFIRCLYGVEDLFEHRVGGGYYRQHLLGMLVVGVLMYGLMAVFGHYYIEGVGYATVQDVLSGAPYPVYLLLLLFVLKLLATSLTLGSGASGGIFSPSLFLGATLGSVYGIALRGLFPQLEISPPALAVAGMAAVVGGATGAAMAAIVMIFEMTLDSDVLLPMTIVVAVSWGVRKILSSDSIYTMKLARRGRSVPQGLRAAPQFAARAGEIMLPSPPILPASSTRGEFARLAAQQPSPALFLVESRGFVVGFMRREMALQALDDQEASVPLGTVVETNYAMVGEQTTLLDVLAQMRATRASVALVAEGSAPLAVDDVKGVITERQIAETTLKAAELFVDPPQKRKSSASRTIVS
jgi:CIC family chloride channel protein